MKNRLKSLFKLTAKAEETANKLPDLLAEVDRVANTMMLGFHGRRRKGQGDAFWQYSEFFDQEHERRRIDWRRSAKEGRLYVKENEWEASESIFLWRDNTPGMDWKGSSSETQYTKKQTSEILLLALAKVFTNVDERVALIGTEGGLSRKIDTLVNELAHKDNTDPEAWKKLGLEGKPLPKDGYAVIFSDFCSSLEDIQAALGRIADRGIKGHLIQVLDREEIEFPYEGNVLFKDLNSHDDVRMPKSENIREEYKKVLAKRQKEIARIAKTLGWTYSLHVTDQPHHLGLMPFYDTGKEKIQPPKP
jgi:uncharacterized protein (DUF58 family)